MESQQELEVVKTCKCACRGTSDTRTRSVLRPAECRRRTPCMMLFSMKEKRALTMLKLCRRDASAFAFEPIVEVILIRKKKVTYVSVIRWRRRIIEQHRRGNIVKDHGPAGYGRETADSDNIQPILSSMTSKKIALRNCGIIDPGGIEDHIATGGIWR